MCNAHGANTDGYRQVNYENRKMKATLEFNYPEDEAALRYAVHGEKAVKALWDVKRYIRDNFNHESDAMDVIRKVREITDMALSECGETV